MCLKSGAVVCAPPIVRDESSRVFLGGALQQSPPLRRPSSMVGQFSLEVNRKDEPAVRPRPPPSSKPAEMRAFYPGTDTSAVWNARDSNRRARKRLKAEQYFTEGLGDIGSRKSQIHAPGLRHAMINPANRV